MTQSKRSGTELNNVISGSGYDRLDTRGGPTVWYVYEGPNCYCNNGDKGQTWKNPKFIVPALQNGLFTAEQVGRLIGYEDNGG